MGKGPGLPQLCFGRRTTCACQRRRRGVGSVLLSHQYHVDQPQTNSRASAAVHHETWNFRKQDSAGITSRPSACRTCSCSGVHVAVMGAQVMGASQCASVQCGEEGEATEDRVERYNHMTSESLWHQSLHHTNRDLLERLYVVWITTAVSSGSELACAQTSPSFWHANRHYYECVVVPEGITWTEARNQAAARSFQNLRGHLATATSDRKTASLRASYQPTWGPTTWAASGLQEVRSLLPIGSG